METLLRLLLVVYLSVVSEAHLVLVGGGVEENNMESIDKFIELAGGVGVAKIGIISTASSSPEESGESYEEFFNGLGVASSVYIPVTETSNNANSAEIEALVSEQTGFWFSGGDQARIVAAWKEDDGSDTNGLAIIRQKLNNGAVIGGTSAGTAVQSDGPMLEGGLSWNGLEYGAYDGGYDPDYPDDLCYSSGAGFSTLPGYILDTHYSERGREGRLIQLLMDTGKNFGMGIDEESAVYISPEGDAEVLGEVEGVMIIDVSGASYDQSKPSKISGVRISYLTEDDTFNIYTGEVTYASWKSNNSGNEYYLDAESSSDIFCHPDKPIRNYGEFRTTAKRLWDSEDSSVISYSWKTDDQFIVTMMKTGGEAYAGYSPVNTDDFVLSYKNMLVNIDYQ